MAAKKAPGTAVANYDEELAKYAGAATGLVGSGGGGKFFSMRAGQLMYDNAALPGNQMAVIVVGHCLENVYYKGAFDPDDRQPPTCFAFCTDPDEKDTFGPPKIVDEEAVFERQSDACADCWANEWGSAEKGRGKACGNRRRLALIPAGTYKTVGRGGGFELEVFDDPAHFKSAEVAYLKTPVTSGKLFDGYLKQVAEQIRKPLFAVMTRIYLEPDANSQFKVQFELLEECDVSLIPTLLERHKKIMADIDFPYTPFEEGAADKGGGAPQAKSKKLARPPAKKAPAKR